MAQRQPIVAVLGHVDHGKTTLLDHIRSLGERTERQASVAARESGGITQHIGATEVPATILNTICGDLVGDRFKTGGLLFIDTPGHHSFHSLRRRGGALADIAVIVVDIMEGMRPQTKDSIQTLMDEKTPFVVALNKLDRIHGWESEEYRSFAVGIKHQNELVKTLLHDQMMKFIGEIASLGLNAELYTTNREVKSTVSMVPCSAQTGEGIADLLAIGVGLSNTFLSERLETEEKGRATILEAKDVRGLGRVVDAIVFDGSFNKGDSIAIPTTSGVRTTTVRAMLRPRGMSEMRDAGDRWDYIDCVQAAGGIRISCQIDGDVIPGGTIVTIDDSDD
ncbi:MAG TPA: GTP-binding protein, partial [Candidatus Poseidoniales archaeon]|nr:GTP-binding protein [Candidatus Poseidoniales archaeon]